MIVQTEFKRRKEDARHIKVEERLYSVICALLFVIIFYSFSNTNMQSIFCGLTELTDKELTNKELINEK